MTRCKRCNRILTDPDSIANGIGPVCAKKARDIQEDSSEEVENSLEEIALSAALNPYRRRVVHISKHRPSVEIVGQTSLMIFLKEVK